MASSKRYEEKKEKGNGVGIVIALFLAALVFVCLVIFSNSIVKSGDKTSVVIAKTNIPENTVITKDNASNYFITATVNEALAYSGVFKSVDKLFANGDIYVTERLSEHEIVAADMITGSNALIASFTDPVSMGIKVSSFENASGGILRRGDTVDVCALDDKGKEMSIRVYILQAFTSNGEPVAANDNSSIAAAFNILIEREDYVTVADIIGSNSSFDLIKVNDVY